jgi:branched-chain amino acid transport system ATP-binding protein
MTPLLSISDLAVSYGAVPAVKSASLEIFPGEVRVILGANGAGKTTIIKTLLGLLRPRGGAVRYDGDHDLLRLKPHQIRRLGIAWVPEGRQLWNTLTVIDNLRMGGFVESDSKAVDRRVDEMFERFPRLKERRDQLAGSLSGGEQQMVAIARALIAAPKLLLMDEPSLGLAPIIVRDVFRLVRDINAMGISILMVEQNARQALRVASWAYLLEVGAIVDSGAVSDIASHSRIQAIFLGGEA